MPDVICDLSGVVIDEMADLVMGNATKLRPGAKRADRRLSADGEHPAQAKTDDIRKLAFDWGRDWRFHALSCMSTHTMIRALSLASRRPALTFSLKIRFVYLKLF